MENYKYYGLVINFAFIGTLADTVQRGVCYETICDRNSYANQILYHLK